MIDNIRLWYLWLSSIPGIGVVKTKRLMDAFGNGERIYRADLNVLMKTGGISENDAGRIKACSNKEFFKENVIEVLRKCDDIGASYICCRDERFPKKLKEIYDTPSGLFFRGSLPDMKRPCVAIVGARDCSSYGKAAADYFARELSQKGIQIISGMARGIDSIAHEAALDACGDTFAVMGCGIDICYPASGIELYENIISRGGVISEYPVGVKASAVNFPMRNRIISGICDAVIVVEARVKSGSLITADLALEQGREVMAVPGRITDKLSFGCNELIKNGAVPVTDISDVERILGITCTDVDKEKEVLNGGEDKIKFRLASYEKIVYDKLCLKPMHVEEIAAEAGMRYQDAKSILMKLMIYGVVAQVARDYYIRC